MGENVVGCEWLRVSVVTGCRSDGRLLTTLCQFLYKLCACVHFMRMLFLVCVMKMCASVNLYVFVIKVYR